MSRHGVAGRHDEEEGPAPKPSSSRAGAVPLGAWLETAGELQERLSRLGRSGAAAASGYREPLPMSERARDYDPDEEGYDAPPRSPRGRRQRAEEPVRRRPAPAPMNPDDLEDVMSAAAAEAARLARRSEMKTASALDAITRWVEAAEGRRAEDTRRLSAAQEKTFTTLRDALELMTGRLDDIERKMTDGRERGFEPIRGALVRLEERIDSLETQASSAGPQNERIGKALDELEKRLSEVVVKIDELGDGRSTGRRDERIGGIEDKLGALLEQLTRQTMTTDPCDFGRLRAEERSRSDGPRVQIRELMDDGRLAEAIDEIQSRQSWLDPEIVAVQKAEQRSNAAVAAVVGLHRDVAELVRNLDAAQRQDPRRDILALRNDVGALARAIGDIAPRAELIALDRRLDDIAGKIEASRDAGLPDRVLKPLENLVVDVARAVEAIGRNRGVDDVRAAVADLAAKVERLDADGADREALSALVQEMRGVKSALAQSGSPQWLGAIQAALTELSRRIDTLTAGSPDVRALTGLSRTVAEVRETLSAAPSAPVIAALEAKLDGLSARIDAAVAAPIDALGARIDTLGARFEAFARDNSAPAGDDAGLDDIRARLDTLTASIENSAARASSDVETLMRDLAGRIDGARDHGVDADALKGIERSLEALSSRVGDDIHGVAAMAQFDGVVRTLLDELGQTRAAAIDAAEQAARSAAREAAREALAQSAPTVSAPPPSDPAVASALTAVQETLERISGRLTVLEAPPAPKAPQTQPQAQPSERMPGAQPAQSVLSPAQPDVIASERLAKAIRPQGDGAPGSRKAPPPPAIETVVVEPPPRKEGVVEAARNAAAKVMQGIGVGAPVKAEDAPLEPGSGRPVVAPSSDATASPSSPGEARAYIAAARRAATQAASEARRESSARRAVDPSSETRPLAPAAGGRIETIRAAIEARRRPLMLGAAAIVLAFGIVQAAKIWMDDGSDPGPTSSLAPLQPFAPPPSAVADAARSRGVAPSRNAADTPAEPASARASLIAPPRETPAEASLSRPAIGQPISGFDPSRFARIEPARPAQAPATSSAPAERAEPTTAGSVSHAPGAPVEAAPAAAAPAPRRDAELPSALGQTALRAGAASGDPKAEFELAARLAVGRGVPKDLAGAAKWYERAAEKGLAPAQYRLGSLLEKGVGVPRDLAAARLWYARAAEAGNARAMHNLAVLAADGGGGRPDYALAAKWFQKAADHGVRDSQYNLAILLARGLGVAQDLKASWRWFAIAAAQGDEDAGRKRDEVATRLPSADLAALRAEAVAFKPLPVSKEAEEVAPPQGGWDAKLPAATPTPPAKTSRL